MKTGWLESDLQFLQIEGTDAADYLHRMTTNEVKGLPVGEGLYQAILNRKGMVRSLFFLFHLEPQKFLAMIPPQLLQKTEEILNKGKFIEKVTVKNVSGEWSLVRVIGTKPEKTGPTPTVWQDPLFKVPVWNILAPRNQFQGFKNLPVISQEAFKILRMESGIPEYGIDIDETHILLEAGLPQFYKRQKGCYPGQEVIERILAYGKGRTPKRLVTLFQEGEQKTPAGEKIEVTSRAFNPLTGKTVFLGYQTTHGVDS